MLSATILKHVDIVKTDLFSSFEFVADGHWSI